MSKKIILLEIRNVTFEQFNRVVKERQKHQQMQIFEIHFS